MINGRLPLVGETNTWFCVTNRDAVLVFVHGVPSDSRGCWLYENRNDTSTEESRCPLGGKGS